MYLLELAAQGVKGCSPTVRAALSTGYVLLKPPASDLLPLGGLAVALLYSDGRGGDVAYLAAGAPTGKAGFTLQGNDLVAYRLMRELGGAGALHRLNKSTQKFELVTQDVLEMGQFLRSQVGLPSKSVFELLFTLSPQQLPSRNPKKAKAEPAQEKKPALAQAAPVAAATDIAAAERRLADLERELALSHEIDQLQFKQDGLASELFELEQRLKSTEGLRVALQEAKAAHAAAPTPESLGLPRDIVSRCERYPTLMQKRDEALAKLNAELGGEDASPAPAPAYAPEPLYKDQRFLAGVALGVAFLVAGALLDGLAKYVALLDIPAFGFAALVALKWVDDLQGAQRTGRKGGMLATRQKKIQDDFEAEAQHVRAAMQALGVESAQEVVDALARKHLLADKVEDLKQQLAAAEADPEFADAARRHQELKQESDQISAELQQRSGGYVRDPREVEREIGRVKESIALARSGVEAAPGPAAVSGPTPSSGIVYEDPSPLLLSLAADAMQSDVPSVAALIKDRCAQYVSALCDRRYLAVEFDLNGQATLTAPDRKLRASELPPKDLDLYFLALRLTIVEKHSAKSKIPLLVEDVLGSVDEAKHPLMGRMFKHLGTLTQVLHVTPNPAVASMADASVSL